jgi:hypothetical protein
MLPGLRGIIIYRFIFVPLLREGRRWMSDQGLNRSANVHRWRDRVAGITLPDTEYTRLAYAAVRRASPEYLVNHCFRTFLLGCLIAQRRCLEADEEIVFISSMLHDLGLTELHRGSLPFEIQGANHAKALLVKSGFSLEKAEIVWDGIAMHTQMIAEFKRPEIMLVNAGASADVIGFGIQELTPEQTADVLERFPRLGMKLNFVAGCAEVVRQFPSAATRSFMRDIGERHVPHCHFTNICDRIASAPFPD